MYETQKNCRSGKTGSLDRIVDHAVTCHDRDDLVLRHERLCDKNLSAPSAPYVSAVCQQKNLILITNSGPRTVYLPCWSARQPAILVVIITSSMSPTIISNAVRKSGFSLRAGEDRKFQQSSQCPNRCSIHSVGF